MVYTENCPCYQCKERNVDCHGKCEKYIKWKEIAKKNTEKEREIRRNIRYEN